MNFFINNRAQYLKKIIEWSRNMNQIIFTPDLTSEVLSSKNTKEYNESSGLLSSKITDMRKSYYIHNKKNLFKIQFFIFVFILICLCLYYMHFRYDLYVSERLSKKLLDNFSITSIYSNNANYSATPISQELFVSKSSKADVIGIIEIKKLNIVYPILSDLDKDLLKISPCKFYGPNPNQTRQSLYCCS